MEEGKEEEEKDSDGKKREKGQLFLDERKEREKKTVYEERREMTADDRQRERKPIDEKMEGEKT